MKLRFTLPLVAFLALATLLWAGLSLEPSKLPSPLIGKPAPEFDLPRLRDPEARFRTADLRGEPALVNVWASWCVTCRQEHPMLERLRNAGVPIYGLNYKDRREDALRYLAQFGDPFGAIGFDEEGMVGIDWGVYATPETFLVDEEGTIRYKHVGLITPEIIENEILPKYRQLEAES
jgi:cytochrome c biogenesis protein CcmG/thiol:disulfide interchange protein DsbE